MAIYNPKTCNYYLQILFTSELFRINKKSEFKSKIIDIYILIWSKIKHR